MPNPPPSPTNFGCPTLSTSSCNKVTMPDFPDSFMNSSLNKIQSALDESAAVGDGNDRNSIPLVNGIDRESSSDIAESLRECGDGSSASTMEIPEEEIDDGFYHVKTLKTEFYETSNGDVVVRVQPKPLDANTVSVYFAPDHFDIVFRTRDSKFLAAHESTNEDTRFRWTCQLSECIKPEQCKVRLQNLIEITLRKDDPKKKWSTLCPVQHSDKPVRRESYDLEAAVSSVSAAPNSSPSVSPKRITTTVMNYAVPLPASRPVGKVPPYSEVGQFVVPGYTGLRNFGNTCFMNAALQALVNTREFRDYFLQDYYVMDIARTNPLGFKGRLAEAFGDFVKAMWSGMNRYFEPCLLKELVGLKASQFANFAQHDAQEFLSFLLDGLHEDLNRVGDKKPLTPTVESDGRPDTVVADEAWRYHLLRNDSVVVDLFHGQLKSRLDCPVCGHTSITFDPFIYLPVPFPKSRRLLTFYFWSLDPFAKPVKYTLSFAEDDSRVADVFLRLSEKTNVKPTQLRMIEVFRQKVFKRYNANESLSLIRPNDVIYVFQVHDPEGIGEEVAELIILQRQLYPRIPSSCHCAGCNKESQDLRACTKCRNAAYCDVKCQQNDWPTHSQQCRPPSPELVGQPFLISLPASKLTFRNLARVLEARSKHTVNVFLTLAVDSEAEKGDEQPTAPPDDPPSYQEIYGDAESDQLQPSAVSTTDSCGGSQTKRIRVVLGEPDSEPRDRALFQLAICNEEGECVLINERETRFNQLEDEQLLKIENGACVAMDWINKKNNTDHLVVLTKDELDYAEDPSLSGAHAVLGEKSLQLADLFEHFTETETLSAEDAWYCSRCREHRQAQKTLQLWRLPSVLIVQLKRFVYTSNIFRNKIDKHVLYPIRDLDVRSYMSEGAAASEEVKTVYDLYAVVCHSGTSFFGHYTGFARLPRLGDSTKSDVEWRSSDDITVNRVQRENQIVDPDAYFLFYKRRDETSGEFSTGTRP